VNVTVRVTKSFKKAAKPLLKKYLSLSDDLLKLESELIENPTLGTSLGHSIYKVRLRISSKGKGKSGGARIISFVEADLIGEVSIVEQEVTVNLIYIYDKTEQSSVTDKELKELIKAFYRER
jgi:mRNA-degrading endonuclease RelE of RelBE toxin-antitoxin system